jgi:PIN domain nuclease of toxin-antitoxin system
MAQGLPMNLLLDTCAILALAEGTLPKRATKSLTTARTAIVPAMVVWELAIKVKTGKLHLPDSPVKWTEKLCSHYSLELQRHSPDIDILCAAVDLPLIHRDPFDRVLVALALHLQAPILTSDRLIKQYPGISVMWS